MIILLTSKGVNKNRVYEIMNSSNYSTILDKLNWLIGHIEDLGYMLVQESSHTFEFANKGGWRFGLTLADEYTQIK